MKALKRLLRRVLDWVHEPEWPLCPGCHRPLASRVPDEAVWRRHFRLTGVRDHSVEACDGEHRVVIIECKYDGYASSREDW